MDNEIDDIKRRAGITEETYSMSAYEEYHKLINSEYEFLGKLAAVITRTMAPNNSRQVIGIIKQRRDEMEKLAREVQGKAEDDKTKAYQANQTDSKSYGRT
jgi:hypothetical protein